MNARTVIGLTALYEAMVQTPEFAERHMAYREARAYCDAVGKPLLRIGIRRSPLEPPNGDTTLDIDPIVLTIPGGVQRDERDMRMFSDRQFGVAFNEHTLEHLHTVEDVESCRLRHVSLPIVSFDCSQASSHSPLTDNKCYRWNFRAPAPSW